MQIGTVTTQTEFQRGGSAIGQVVPNSQQGGTSKVESVANISRKHSMSSVRCIAGWTCGVLLPPCFKTLTVGDAATALFEQNTFEQRQCRLNVFGGLSASASAECG